MSVGKNYCSFFVQFTDKLCYEAQAITPNVFGLCVSLPLHKCSNYRQKLIGQIAQNPCYTLFVLIFCAVGINH